MVAFDLLQLTKFTTTDRCLLPLLPTTLQFWSPIWTPKNGTVAYDYARICAKLLKLSDQFIAEYSCMEGHRVDVGEFNVWALNLL